MGRRPKDDGPIFSEVTIRGHPVLVTTPDHTTYHTKCQMPVHFFRASPYVGVLHVRTGPFVTMVPPAPDMRDRAIVHGAWMTICVKCELTIKW